MTNLQKRLTKQFLYKLYIIKKLSTVDINRLFGYSITSLCRYLYKYKIKIRKNIHKKVYCVDCGKLLCYGAFHNKNKRCNKCNSQLKCKPYPKCVDCGKELSDYRIIRCRKCFNICNRKENHGHYKGGKPNCIDCGKELPTYKGKRCKQCYIMWAIGENNPNYVHGNGYQGYPNTFNEELKEKIRTRDNFTCQCCGMTEEEHVEKCGRSLSIHHIDYNKQNCKKDNLITTCIICNNKANYDRDYWFAYYTYIMENL